MKRIGFIHYDGDDDDKSSSNKDKQSPQVSNRELFRQFISAKYLPYGPKADMQFRTSRELGYECREMCEPSLPDIASVMTELGFKSDQFCGQYTWMLYDKEPVRY